tara:strand:- start:1892 stop:2017 length:126 start_codon:yes stop_codon:yes gene_type:complete
MTELRPLQFALPGNEDMGPSLPRDDQRRPAFVQTPMQDVGE